MITIENNIRLPRSQAKKEQDARIRKAREKYAAAYQKVYGIRPEVSWDGTFFRIVGHTAGVTLARLKEMTSQLRWRAGGS